MPLLDLLLGIDNNQHVGVRLAWQVPGDLVDGDYLETWILFSFGDASKSKRLDMISFVGCAVGRQRQ